MTRFILTFTLLISSCALSPHVTFPAHSDSPSVPTQHQSSGSTVLQLAFSREAQLFDRETSVFGLRLGLLSSDNHRVHGIDSNLVKGISGGGSGIATSLGMNWVTQDFNGIQIAAIMNAMDGRRGEEQQGPRMSGLQIALVANNARRLKGIQAAAVNISCSSSGMQLGLGNDATNFYGVQVSLVNMAGDSYGLQVAPVNHGGVIHGAQFGLWNRARSGLQIGRINFNENGFLPLFPFVKF